MIVRWVYLTVEFTFLPLSAEAPHCGLDCQLLTGATLSSSSKDAGGLCCPEPLYD